MSKIEFIEQLRRNLASINDYTFVNDTIAYYENYIESQIRMGKMEEQVMQELGDPRLIAKSICASHTTEEEAQNGNGYADYRNNKGTSKRHGAQTIMNLNGRLINMPSWLIKILTFLVIFVVLFLVFTILRFLSPFIFFGCIAYMIYKFIVGRTG